MDLEELLNLLKENDQFKDVDVANIVSSAISKSNDIAVSGLKNKNSELLAKLKNVKSKFDKVPEDFDQTKWDALIESEKLSEENKLKDESRWDELRNKLVDSHNTDISNHNSKISELKAALSRELIDNAIMPQLAKAGAHINLMMPHITPLLSIKENEKGEYAVTVVDNAGEERLSTSKPGAMMQVDELVNEFKANADFSSGFKVVNSGGGATTNNTFNGTNNPFVRGDNFSLTEQAKLYNSDVDLANKMKLASNKT